MRQVLGTAALIGLAALMIAGAEALAADSPREGPHLLKADEHRVGELIDDVSFVDLDGKAGKTEFALGSQAAKLGGA